MLHPSTLSLFEYRNIRVAIADVVISLEALCGNAPFKSSKSPTDTGGDICQS
jgi:hypothetical protein